MPYHRNQLIDLFLCVWPRTVDVTHPMECSFRPGTEQWHFRGEVKDCVPIDFSVPGPQSQRQVIVHVVYRHPACAEELGLSVAAEYAQRARHGLVTGLAVVER